jgi:hypothetical protein
MSTKEHRSHNSRIGHQFHANDSGNAAAPEITQMLEAGQQVMHTWQSIADEVRQLGRRQLEHGLEATKAVSSCGDPRRAYELQMEYWRRAAESYAQASQACMTLAARAMTDGYAGMMSAPSMAAGTWGNWLTKGTAHETPPPSVAA